MKELHGEGLATHTGPESCAGVREAVGEALTGARAGPVLSREIIGQLRGADAVEIGGMPHWARRYREMRPDPARSETRCMHGNISHGNREVPHPPEAGGAAGRTGKSEDVRR